MAAGNVIEILIKARDEASKVIDKNSNSLKSWTSGIGAAIKGATGLDLATVGFAGALAYAGKQLMNVTNETQAYNLSIIDMAKNLGISTEEASKLVQVGDDLRISQQELETMFRSALKNGIEPTREGLAKAADEYNKLGSNLEKKQYLLDNFGRAGLNIGKMFDKGSEGVKDFYDSVEDGLVVTEEAARVSEEYYAAVDELTDKWLAFKYAVGNKVIPVITDLLDGEKETTVFIKAKIRELEIGIAQQKRYGIATADSERELKYWSDRLMQARDAQYDLNKEEDTAIDKTEELKRQLSDLQLVMDGAYGNMQEKYVGSQQKLTDEANGYLSTIQELSALPWLTDDQKKDLDEAKTKWQEITGAIVTNAAEHDKETKKFVIDMLIKRLSLDEFSAADAAFIAQLSKDWGLIDQQTLDLITSADAYNQMLKDGTVDAKALADQVAGIQNKTVTITVRENHIIAGDPTRTYPLLGGAANGADFDVPRGYPNDSGLLAVSSGEHVQVTPEGKRSGSGNNYYISFPGMVTLGTQADLERNLGPIIKKYQRQSA